MKISKIGTQQEIRISVRKLVEFILRHGDIDNRHHASPDNAMQEGSRIHRMIQRRMGSEYQAEVSLKYVLPAEGYALVVEGRADGIIRHGGQATVDEIKGTRRELVKMRGPLPLHLAQAKCYAYMYGIQQGITEIGVRLTYCNIFTEEQRYFEQDYTLAELEEWFQSLLSAYRKWADYVWEWRHIRQTSIEGLEFPFPYRRGQRELAADVYRTIYHKKKLFLEAPTGVGKTITTIYPAVCAIGRGMGEKLFYLTAKTITRTVAEDTMHILRGKGLRMKSMILTAKEKICFMGEADCNPEHCLYARGHYDRINEAVYGLLTSQESFSRERIEAYARKYQVCPFEMGLDMSLFADMVICDYNYLFDPHVYLKRFFGESGEGKNPQANSDYIFLIDEAHNLLERGREMYSAALRKEQFLELRREIKQTVMSERNVTGKKADISGQISFSTEVEMTQVLTGVSQKESGERDLMSESRRDAEGVGCEGGHDVQDGGCEGRHDAQDGVCEGGQDVQDGVCEDRQDVQERFSEGVLGAEEELSGIVSGGEDEEDEDDVEDMEDMEAGRSGGAGGFRGGSSILVRQGYADRLSRHLKRCDQELLALKRECGQCRILESLEGFVQPLMRLHTAMEDYLSEQEEAQLPVREALLDFYFTIGHFLLIYDLMDDNYVRYAQKSGEGGFLVKLLCVNPRENLKRCMLRGRSTILFSATFLPVQYYKKLLGGDGEDYEVYAQSVFDPARRALLIAGDVTSRYARRSQEEYDKIARYIEEIVKNRRGNYMVFCPSYAFLRTVYEVYVDNFAGEGRECIIQGESMSEGDREEFLARFQGGEAAGRSGTGEEMKREGRLAPAGEELDVEGKPAPAGADMETGGEPAPVGEEMEGKPAPAGADMEMGGESAPVGEEMEGRPAPAGNELDVEGRPAPAGADMETGGEPAPAGEHMGMDGGPVRMEEWENDRILIGFCVLGGIFGEGIDLKNDSLIGVVIVGTGLPQVCDEREILRSCFDDKGEDGFDYSYRYPGMNKVLQAAGRVIRTVDDVGIIALLDDRFLQMSYRRLFPREWEYYEAVTVDTVAKRVERFWKEWL